MVGEDLHHLHSHNFSGVKMGGLSSTKMLILGAAVIAALDLGCARRDTTANESILSAGTAEAASNEPQVLYRVNRERAERGLDPLASDAGLEKAAQDFAADMNRRGYFSHRSPEGESFTDRLKRAGVRFSAAAENIARGQTNVDQVMNEWMSSAGHRANILNPNLRRIGIGRSGGLWVQEFAD